MGRTLSVVPPAIDRTQFQYNPLPAHPRRRGTQAATLLTGDEANRRLTQAIEEAESEDTESQTSSSRKRKRPEPARPITNDQNAASDADDPREAAHWRKVINSFSDSKEGRFVSISYIRKYRYVYRYCYFSNSLLLRSYLRLPYKYIVETTAAFSVDCFHKSACATIRLGYVLQRSCLEWEGDVSHAI